MTLAEIDAEIAKLEKRWRTATLDRETVRFWLEYRREQRRQMLAEMEKAS